MQLGGSVALITGGASGLGAVVARVFRSAGAKVALVDLNATAGAALAGAFGANGCFLAADVTSDDDLQAVRHLGSMPTRPAAMDGRPRTNLQEIPR